ncbi:MAG: flagellar motor switch phosphatase FliY, partial [Exiguobacterium chiriqhucha]
DEIRLSAVQEAMNQMMGAAATSLSTVFSKKIDISPPLVEVFDATKNQTIIDRLELWETMVLIEFNLKVGTLIDSKIVQIAPVQFGKQLVNELMAATSPAPVAPAPAAAPVAPKQEAPKAPAPAAQQPVRPAAKSVPEVAVSQAEFMPLHAPATNDSIPANLGLLYDVPLNVTVELGRTKRSVREVLELSQGSIIELDKLAGEPVDIYVNQQRIARGEVVVIEENFGVRVTEIIQPHERIGIV